MTSASPRQFSLAQVIAYDWQRDDDRLRRRRLMPCHPVQVSRSSIPIKECSSV